MCPLLLRKANGHLTVWAMLALGCGHVATGDRDAASDANADSNSNAAIDAMEPTTAPTFVQSFTAIDCGSFNPCTIQTPGKGPGRLLVMIVTYNSTVRQIESVTDSPGVPLQRAFEPLQWAGSGGNWRTEVWWGHRHQDSTTTTVSLSGPPAGFSYYYASEFVATSIDQVAAATGTLTTAGMFSSGARNTAYPNELVFAHGEGEMAMLSPGSGFTARRGNSQSVLEQTKSADAKGAYEAPFSMDRSGHWLALMLTLR